MPALDKTLNICCDIWHIYLKRHWINESMSKYMELLLFCDLLSRSSALAPTTVLSFPVGKVRGEAADVKPSKAQTCSIWQGSHWSVLSPAWQVLSSDQMLKESGAPTWFAICSVRPRLGAQLIGNSRFERLWTQSRPPELSSSTSSRHLCSGKPASVYLPTNWNNNGRGVCRDLGALRGHPAGGTSFLYWGWLLRNAAKRQIWVTLKHISMWKELTEWMDSTNERFRTALSWVSDDDHSFLWLVRELAA